MNKMKRVLLIVILLVVLFALAPVLPATAQVSCDPYACYTLPWPPDGRICDAAGCWSYWIVTDRYYIPLIMQGAP